MIERFINFVKGLLADAAESVDIKPELTQTPLYRAGYANGYRDALNELWGEIEEEVGE